MERAYSTLVIKALSDEGGKRTFKGIASTPSTDRSGDIVEPKGAVFKLPMPFLWQHDSRDPIGWITSAKVTDKGIEVEGEVADVEEEGELKTRLTTAWQMLKSKLVRGLSMGFKPLEASRIEGSFGMRYTKWLWFELSAVTVPANADASITTIKSIDKALLAATGHVQDRVVRLLPPGVSGTTEACKGVVYLK
jgi:HK97 family phage prohead protease